MTAEEWINEFSSQPRPTTTTVLHASNVRPASKVSAGQGEHPDVSSRAGNGQGYRFGALCVAGLVGFVMARAFTA